MRHKQTICVLGLISNTKGEYLITLRSEPRLKAAHLKWQIPGGGVEFGEEPMETVKREMKEELDVEVTVGPLIQLAASSIWHYPKTTSQVILFCYLCKIKKGVIKVDGTETLDFKWIKPKELDQLPILPLTKTFTLAAEKMIKHGHY